MAVLSGGFVLSWMVDSGCSDDGTFTIFFLNPYRMAFFCEMYAEVRREAKENGIFGSERLCDTYLYEIPSRSVLEEAYGNLVTLMDEPLPEYTRLRGNPRIHGAEFRHNDL